jgi:hypothetical protein
MIKKVNNDPALLNSMMYKALQREHEPHSNNNDIQSTTQKTRATLKQQ